MWDKAHTWFFFYNTQIYNNAPTPKLLVAIRVAELLIYLCKPSKLGDVGQSPDIGFFLEHTNIQQHTNSKTASGS